jgi:hypothetical protein
MSYVDAVLPGLPFGVLKGGFPQGILSLQNQISKYFEPASKWNTHRLANILTNRIGFKQLFEQL